VDALCVWARPPPSAGASLLLVKRDRPPFVGAFALPGGFVDQNEKLDAAAKRELEEETGLALGGQRLKQRGAYGDPGRDPRGWTLTVLYTAPLQPSPSPPPVKGGDDARDAVFRDLTLPPPPLAFDHAVVIADGLQAMAEGEAAGNASLQELLTKASEAYRRAPTAAAQD
jgi:8-oxo-dGTP diphosphatase